MATPAFLRYLPARLKPLSAPAVWAPLTVFALISAFMWEYHNNPNWFNRPQADLTNPDSSLTAEEQAQLSEIDTLDILLKQTNRPASALGTNSEAAAGTAPGTALGTASGTNAANQPNGTQAGDAAPNQETAKRENPFTAYAEQYRIPGSANSTRVTTPALSASGSQLSGSTPSSNINATFSGGLGSSPASTPIGNALSEALTRQQQSRQSTAAPTTGSATTSRSESASSQPAASASSGVSNDLPNLPTSNSGISAPYIRTTPNMSPPVGTTGYQPPASSSLPVFNVEPPQPSRNPYFAPFQQNFSQPQSAVPQSVAPLPSVAPTGGSYTAPSFTQPEQTRTLRQPTF
jgi:hypothetical protein